MELVKDQPARAFPTTLDALTFRFEDVPRLLRRTVDSALYGYELSRTQWRLLAYVLREEGMTQTELARCLELERASVGQAIDALERKQLLERTKEPGDRRVWRIMPTRKARQLLPELRDTINEIYEQMFRGFSAAEIDKLHSYLDRIMVNFGD
ncbi:MarR family winged helix-turn-helix transcriptional regulator [Parasphingorhabdus halotolerans]|uniref:MarR family transcriptional regulator n=1 Tax=Parasphingorhabdus halotolerans TaxID=2725558 RepID=A0A6H2DHW0_9SPHN|nr:MarR family transcriptional regulator [Parasphingorhabdus halotolerans]QJB68259.1 MarR family transcriptional regulator [Parasphingorhabdus halotolerans]QJB69456.1 MarR family transcriptional regulator [Parasphingorhabdus halotolerans]